MRNDSSVATLLFIVIAVIGALLAFAVDSEFKSGISQTILVLFFFAAVFTACITGIALVGIPLAGLVFSIFRKLLDWKPMSPTVKTILVILWVISLIASIILFPIIGIPYWNHHIYTITI